MSLYNSICLCHINGPKNIKDNWNGLNISNIDSAVYNSDTDKYYFFKDDEYWTKEKGKDVTGPKTIKDNWNGLNM